MLTTVETKVKSFNFWGEVKKPEIVAKEDTSLPSAYEPFDFSVKDDGSPAKDNFMPFMQQPSFKGGSRIKYEMDYVAMPEHPKFWHFHPMAFVEQMRLASIKQEGFVDWKFIGKQEGSEVLIGYVPSSIIEEIIEVKDKKGKPIFKDGIVQTKTVKKEVAIQRSGVTIATGFDIGQHNSHDLFRIFKNDLTLYNLYLPFANKIKQDAIDFLKDNPLAISYEQARKTDELVKNAQLGIIIRRYNSFNISKEFKFQSVGIQTVVVSICFQYGAHSDNLNPMWSALVEDDKDKLLKYWENQINNTIYKHRRKLEMEFLKKNYDRFE